MIYQRSQKEAVNLTNTHTYEERQRKRKYNQSQDTQQYTTSTTTKTKVKQTKNPKPMEEREKIFKAKQTNTRQKRFFVKLCVYSCIKANEKPKTKPSKNERCYVSAEQNNTKHTISETMCECKLFNQRDKQKRTNLKSSANNKTSKPV